MNVPSMYWHGWFTLVIPIYLMISAIIGWFIQDMSLPDIRFLLNVIIINTLIALVITIYAVRSFDEWKIHVIIPLLLVDAVFIITASLIFGYLLRPISPSVFVLLLLIFTTITILLNVIVR